MKKTILGLNLVETNKCKWTFLHNRTGNSYPYWDVSSIECDSTQVSYGSHHVGTGYEKLSYTLKQKVKGPKTMAKQIKDPVINSLFNFV